jgi:hypothetical protein
VEDEVEVGEPELSERARHIVGGKLNDVQDLRVERACAGGRETWELKVYKR